MDQQKLDSVRASVLTQMERSDRMRLYAIAAAAICEALFLILAITLTDAWRFRHCSLQCKVLYISGRPGYISVMNMPLRQDRTWL